jgi:peptidoglycan/LPS O-acetylase OafA/YrhL
VKNLSVNTKTNNYDLLRLLFALCVVLVHLSILTQSSAFSGISAYISSKIAIDSFFVISGFLITLSYENSSSLKNYYSKRLRRIYPAYFVVIILCVMAGVIISVLPWNHYLNNKELIKYIIANLSFLNFLHPNLPGVFTHNYLNAVNGALWTIKIEVLFYLVLPIIIYFLNKYHRLGILMALYLFSLVWMFCFTTLASKTGKIVYLDLARQLPGQLSFFTVGIFAYYYHHWLKQNKLKLLLIAMLGALIFHYYPNAISFLWPASLGVLVIYVGNFAPYLGNFGKYGDVSYGVYIFHFPTIQVLTSLGLFAFSPLLGFLTTMLVVLVLAFLSWHAVEKRFLFAQSHYKKEALN